MFSFLNSAATAANNTSQSEQLLNEADLGLVPFFGTNANFESSDLAIEEKNNVNNNNCQQQNLNNSSSQLNQSFSTLFNTKSSSNPTNLVSMLNGFL